MGYSNMRNIFANSVKFGQSPTRYSRVKSEDPLDPEMPDTLRRGSVRRSREAWKSPLLVLAYAVLTSTITCLVMWTFPPNCRRGAGGEGPLLKTPVPECKRNKTLQGDEANQSSSQGDSHV